MLADVMLVGVCAWFLWSDVSEVRAGDVGMAPRTWAFMLNLTCVFVLVHRGMSVLQRALAGAGVGRAAGVAKWTAAIVLPLVVATSIERQAHRVHKEKLDALAADVAQRIQASLGEQGRVTPGALATLESPYLKSLAVQTDTGTFAIEAVVPAIGSDVYRAHYTSRDPGWRLDASEADDAASVAPGTGGSTLHCGPAPGALSCR
jgi:hypothetical protein